jgi:hypothetical protein
MHIDQDYLGLHGLLQALSIVGMLPSFSFLSFFLLSRRNDTSKCQCISVNFTHIKCHMYAEKIFQFLSLEYSVSGIERVNTKKQDNMWKKKSLSCALAEPLVIQK